MQMRARAQHRAAADFRHFQTTAIDGCRVRPPRPSDARLLLLGVALAACGGADGDVLSVTLATTHTVEDTGLLDELSRAFAAAHPEIRLRIVVAGSGEALAFGRRGDADVVLTHAPEDEAEFVAEGHGVERWPILRNEFVLYGPNDDPAKIRGTADVAEAFRRIEAQRAPFISRGDDSGTHKRERAIWAAAGEDPAGSWYEEAGVGQADALRIASERRAYILADRATFAVLEPAPDLMVVSAGDPRLVNTYSVIRATRSARPEQADTLTRWLTSGALRALIQRLGTDAEGRPLFEPIGAGAATGVRLKPPQSRIVAATHG
jgi:tungstate transport system substrate-binding protein